MKSYDGSPRFALMKVLYNLQIYSEKDRDTWVGRDGMGGKEQRKAKVGENSQFSLMYFLRIHSHVPHLETVFYQRCSILWTGFPEL